MANEQVIRIDDPTADVMLTASAGIEIKKNIYKPIVDEGRKSWPGV
jgi:hypothetical protein